jgi:hypothetical protein
MFIVKGMMSDSRLSTEFDFKLEVFNNPPHLKERLADQTVKLGAVSTYTLPSIEDEEGLPVKMAPQLPLPSFTEYDAATKTFKFAANKTRELGRYTISLCFTDGYSAEQCLKFGITVEDPSRVKRVSGTNASKMTESTKKAVKNVIFSKFKASMQIKKISRDGIVSLFIFAQKGQAELIGEILNTSISVSLVTQDYKDVDFFISNIKAPLGIIELKVNFPDPSKISSSLVSSL